MIRSDVLASLWWTLESPLLECCLKILMCTDTQINSFPCCYPHQDMTGLDPQEATKWRFCKIPHTDLKQAHWCIILIAFALWHIQIRAQCSIGDCGDWYLHKGHRCALMSHLWLQPLSKCYWLVLNFIKTGKWKKGAHLLISHDYGTLILSAPIPLCMCWDTVPNP